MHNMMMTTRAGKTASKVALRMLKNKPVRVTTCPMLRTASTTHSSPRALSAVALPGNPGMCTESRMFEEAAARYSTSRSLTQSAAAQEAAVFEEDEDVAREEMTETTTPRTSKPKEASNQKKKKRRKSRLETKDPIILTQTAADRIQELLAKEKDNNAIGLRLGVRRRGCNGLSYTLNYAYATEEDEQDRKKDISMTSYGVNIWIDPMALFNVVGTVMDWEETELASEFTFNNPNSKGECGCGESFNV